MEFSDWPRDFGVVCFCAAMYFNFGSDQTRNELLALADCYVLLHVWPSLLRRIYRLSRHEIFFMIQMILTFLIVLLALLYLIRRYFFSKKNSAVCGGCESGCGIDSSAALSCQKPNANTEQRILLKDIQKKKHSKT